MDHITLSNLELETSSVECDISGKDREVLEDTISMGAGMLRRGIIALESPTGSLDFDMHENYFPRKFLVT